MSFKKVSKLIEKINVLHDSLLSIDEEISSIEKDLLLNYIRQLYEEVLAVSTSDQKAKVVQTIDQTVIDLPKPQPEPIIREEIKQEKIEVRQNGHQNINVPAVTVDTIPEPKKIEVEKEDEILEEIRPVELQEITEEMVDEATGDVDVTEELIALFEMKEAKELSEKLSSLPIKDLRTAMGINDRFLTVNELFGGDNTAFVETIEMINGMKDYNEAKSFLLRKVAVKYNWSDADKLKKAAGFISLVQRRFK